MCSARTIVLTRDQSACNHTKKAILHPLAEAMLTDVEIISAPVRELVGMDDSSANVDAVDALIFTSANALEFCKQDLNGMRTYCVGDWTASCASQRGCEVVEVASNARELSEKLAQLPPSKLFYIRAQTISTIFEDNPKLAKHQFQNLICYQAVHREWGEDEITRINNASKCIFPVFSKESAKSILKNLLSLPSHFRAEILPISEGVAREFDKNSRFQVVMPPQKPNLEQMIKQIHFFL